MNATIADQLRGFLPQEQPKPVVVAPIVSPRKHTGGERKWREAKRLRQREERLEQRIITAIRDYGREYVSAQTIAWLIDQKFDDFGSFDHALYEVCDFVQCKGFRLKEGTR